MRHWAMGVPPPQSRYGKSPAVAGGRVSQLNFPGVPRSSWVRSNDWLIPAARQPQKGDNPSPRKVGEYRLEQEIIHHCWALPINHHRSFSFLTVQPTRATSEF